MMELHWTIVVFQPILAILMYLGMMYWVLGYRWEKR